MKDFNHERVIHYDRSDWAAGHFRDRIIEVLPTLATFPITSVNDAIEAHQSRLTVEEIPELFQEDELPTLRQSATTAFANACRYVNTALKSMGIRGLYDDLERQYVKQFWDLLSACHGERNIKGDDLRKLLVDSPYCLGYALEAKKLVALFDTDLRKAILSVPQPSAELVISQLAMDSIKGQTITLPSSLSNEDLDSIMLAYLDGDHPNPNYVEALTRWPNRLTDTYHPSPDVRVKAKRMYEEQIRELFSDGAGLHAAMGVVIDGNQKACRGVRIKNYELTYVFGGKWLEAHMDPATIMNNCRWVFDFVDARGMLQAPAHAHEESSLVELLGPHVRGEYRDNLIARQRQAATLLETRAYAEFLKRHKTNLESVIEWTYGTYFPEEYGIDGFGISLPSRNGTWLDKCKSIGSEIERAMKEYQLYAKRGTIEEEYLLYEEFKSFGDAPALTDGKYFVAGPEFLRWVGPLFSDQSMLAYAEGKRSDERSFYGLMISGNLAKANYLPFYYDRIEQLVEKGLVYEEEGLLKPTERTRCLHLVWRVGAIPARYYGGKAKKIMDALASEGLLERCNSLFSPDEARYLNYMYNDSEQTNAIGLRNRYSHAKGFIRDPNADDIRADYYAMLALLVSITLKINDELMDKTGRGGIRDFDDWPLYDESVHKAVESLAREGSAYPASES